ncbi:hypothetical protein LTR66_010461 [Elasticomyces elasticus]|nr:hypothetical protein LTR66_010461 [Elasticomyces elasticus]
MPSKYASTPIEALYHVFILPRIAASRSQSFVPPIQRTGLGVAAFAARRTDTSSHYVRAFSTTTACGAKNQPAAKRTQAWDEEIHTPTGLIILVNPETNKLEDPRTRFDILNSMDREVDRLIQVSPPEPENPDYIPTCKILSKKETYESERTKAKIAYKAKSGATESRTKSLEINWAIDGNDLGHRLRRLQEFLDEGKKVEVTLAAKKRGRKATPEEAGRVLSRIGEVVDSVGGRQTRPMEGKLGGFAMLAFEGNKR